MSAHVPVVDEFYGQAGIPKFAVRQKVRCVFAPPRTGDQYPSLTLGRIYTITQANDEWDGPGVFSAGFVTVCGNESKNGAVHPASCFASLDADLAFVLDGEASYFQVLTEPNTPQP